MRIIVDAMSGDNAPRATVWGAISAREKLGVDITLVGVRSEIEAMAKGQLGDIQIVESTELIDMTDDPATAFRRKPNSSMALGLKLLRDGEGDAFVSAGNTGALLTAATILVKRIRGIRRAALAPVVPNGDRGFMLIDCGANAECTPEYLLQFAFMGNFYAKSVMGIERPRVGLLSNGTEDKKGTQMHQDTYKLLTAASNEGRINFVGNVEGSGVMFNAADVVVADGFSGNILLKSLEGTAKFLLGKLRDNVFGAGLKGKVSGALVLKEIRALKDILDPDMVGGTALMGISKPVIKAHGSASDIAIYHAIRQAKSYCESDITREITDNMEYMRLENKAENEEEK